MVGSHTSQQVAWLQSYYRQKLIEMGKPILHLLIYRVKSQGHLALAVKLQDIRDCEEWGVSASRSNEPTLVLLTT